MLIFFCYERNGTFIDNVVTRNTFRITGLLSGESANRRWISLTNFQGARKTELSRFIFVSLNNLLKQSDSRWFEMPWKLLWLMRSYGSRSHPTSLLLLIGNWYPLHGRDKCPMHESLLVLGRHNEEWGCLDTVYSHGEYGEIRFPKVLEWIRGTVSL